MELSAENYIVAWELLKERYDNRKIIRQTHVKALLNLPNLSKVFPIRLFVDQVQKHVRALQALKEPVDKWDTLLVEMIKQKLSSFIREKWEDASCDSENPTYKELITFLQRRAQFEDTKLGQPQVKFQNLSDKKPFRSQANHRQAFAASTATHLCPHCQGAHLVYACEQFKKLSPQKRFEATKRAALCINYLRSNHRISDCTSSPCRKCGKMHHTLLHFEKKSSSESVETAPVTQNQPLVTLHTHISSEGLLGTAIVDLVNAQGTSKKCRIFLDSGSQANFITEATASFLKLHRKPVDVSVSCVENISTEIKHSVSVTLKSRFNQYSKKLELFVLNQITKNTINLD